MGWYNTTYDEIYHHGIDNQQWGVRNGPPYPLKPAVSSAVKQGKSREEIRAAKKRAKNLKKARAARAKKREEAAKAKKKAEKQEKAQDQRKNKSGKSPTLMYKNRDLFTTQELKDLADRFAAENRVQELSSKRIQTGKDVVNNLLNVAEGGIRGYNMVARLYNTFSNGNTELPYVSGASTGESKNKKGKGNNK